VYAVKLSSRADLFDYIMDVSTYVVNKLSSLLRCATTIS
jgi:hypothetical protein